MVRRKKKRKGTDVYILKDDFENYIQNTDCFVKSRNLMVKQQSNGAIKRLKRRFRWNEDSTGGSAR